MSASDSQITVGDDQQRPVLRLNGVFGVGEAGELRGVAIEVCGREKGVHVDWSNVAQLDTSIVQVLWSLRVAVAAAGREFSITSPGEAVRQYLQTAGMSSILDGNAPA